MNDIMTMFCIFSLALVFIGSVIYFSPINKLIETNTSKKEYETLMEITDMAVKWAEQYLSSKTGQEKKEEVENYLYEKANEIGLCISADDIDKAIESAVLKLKERES